jgi:tetratricopeptide (TPR) repeat protein
MAGLIYSLCNDVVPTKGNDIRDWMNYQKYLSAKRFYRKGNYTEAYQLFNSILNRNQHRTDAHTNVGICLVQLNNAEKAVSYFEAALKIDNNDFAANNNLAYAYEKLKRNDEAHEIYDKLISRYPNDYTSYYRKATLYGRENSSKCIEYYKKCLQIKDGDSAIYCNLGLAYYWSNDFENAKSNFEKSLLMNSSDISTLNNYGYVLSKYEKFSDAIQYLNKCLVLDESYAYAYNNRGYCYLKLGDLDKGIKDIEKSLYLDNANFYAYKNRAIYHLALNESKKALDDLQKAQQLGFTEKYDEEMIHMLSEIKK